MDADRSSRTLGPPECSSALEAEAARVRAAKQPRILVVYLLLLLQTAAPKTYASVQQRLSCQQQLVHHCRCAITLHRQSMLLSEVLWL